MDTKTESQEIPEINPESEFDLDLFNPTKTYNSKIDYLRFFLLLFLSISLFDFQIFGKVGAYITLISQFASTAFFIISGFLVLGEDEESEFRILRTISRTAITFAALLISYFLINAAFFFFGGGQSIFRITDFSNPRFWFDIFVLNVWPYPIGDVIWLVGALLYSYTIVFIVKKLKLLRFDYIFFVIFAILELLSTEFAGFINFNLFGVPYLSHFFLTRALPYIFLGSFIKRKLDFFIKISPFIYIATAILGAVMLYFEGLFVVSMGKYLVYSHFIGHTLIAFSVLMLTIPLVLFNQNENSYFTTHLPLYNRWIYYLIQPVSVLIAFFFATVTSEYFNYYQSFMWLIAFLASFVIAFIIGLIKDVFIALHGFDEEYEDTFDIENNIPISDENFEVDDDDDN